ncbi:MAG: protein-disulfide reductase DsbD family protein [Chitinophagaceae bacterium]
MKKIIGTCLLSVVATIVFGQNVTWKFSATKTTGNNYQLLAVAAVPTGWHIYSSTTPEGGPVPTTFTFGKNPLVQLKGKVQEKGVLKTIHHKNFDVDVKYYADKVVFVQDVQVKSKAKTTVNGSVNYMICNDQQCLPPVTEKFAVELK